jgi:glycine dehydrogenase
MMDAFVRRHVPHRPEEVQHMLSVLGEADLEQFTDRVIPEDIRLRERLALPAAMTEAELYAHLRHLAQKNRLYRSYIGMGYYGTHTPAVIRRLILENPAWYTAYTPYQPEIAQGRLEMLFYFQTMVSSLTGLPMANASLLDEATAAAEALYLFYSAAGKEEARRFFVDALCHPQVIGVVQTRAYALGIEVEVGLAEEASWGKGYFGALLAYPGTDGWVRPHFPELIAAAKAAGVRVAVASDLLFLTLAMPPGEMGADIVLGSSQRFGVPMGYGGPHAAFFAVQESYKRLLPGRLVGLSVDAEGRPAYRLALQTREQHIKRERATSNICTAQVLLAHMATAYAIYHGPEGLKTIATKIHAYTLRLAETLQEMGYNLRRKHFFDTLTIEGLSETQHQKIRQAAHRYQINLRYDPDGSIGLSLDETVTEADLQDLIAIFREGQEKSSSNGHREPIPGLPESLKRTTPILTAPVFHQYQGEAAFTRFLTRLSSRDISLIHSMIPLGSCTMKLNPVATLEPISWPELAHLHPFVPLEQAQGYHEMIQALGEYLCRITGFAAVSFQPNSGAQGEYTGLLVIKRYHEARGEGHRDVVLVPSSAHGTNPASAVLAGYQVVVVAADAQGNIDLADLEKKLHTYGPRVAALMVTYPSTHGIFERHIRTITEKVHAVGGQVYMDGANLNAQVGLTSPARIGADVCHINLHKTFAIPHGGGGPGMGPIAVASHLVPYLPTHPVIPTNPDPHAIGPVAAAPYGSALILWISYAYIRLMGAEGLRYASQIAILNANYLKARLSKSYPILYTDPQGYVAHEFILDLRPFKRTIGLEPDDVAKRLMDFGFHAPTMSFPVPGTLMIEPTESEDLAELERFIEAMEKIRAEIAAVEAGVYKMEESPLRRAPHTASTLVQEPWDRPYSRAEAAFPLPWVSENKIWPFSARIDHAYGDRNLVCVCPPVEAYETKEAQELSSR